jgi:hypothetical protein
LLLGLLSLGHRLAAIVTIIMDSIHAGTAAGVGKPLRRCASTLDSESR